MSLEKPQLVPHLHAAVEAGNTVVVASLIGYPAAGVLEHVHDVLDGELAAHLAEERQVRRYAACDPVRLLRESRSPKNPRPVLLSPTLSFSKAVP